MTTLRVVNGRLVLQDRVVEGHQVVVADGAIAAVVPDAEAPAGGEVLDAAGRWVTPGLVDIHVHGGRGTTFNDPDAAGSLLATLAGHGVTSVLPTLGTAPLPELLDAVASYRQRLPQLRAGSAGARAWGLHLEGPLLSPVQRGAHPEEWLRVASDGSGEALRAVAGSLSMVTLAPELPGALEFTEALVRSGTVVAIGHSDADAPTFRAAVAAGARHATHLWSGQSTFRRSGPWRVAGVLESSLTEPGITAEVIGDGHHLSAELLRVAYACVGDRLCLVSDACSGTDLDEGARFQLAGVTCRIVEGAAVVEGRDVFAGSTTYLDGMIGRMIETLGLDVSAAVRMATTVPAAALGRPEIGRLVPGALADLAVFDDAWDCRASVVGGRIATVRDL